MVRKILAQMRKGFLGDRLWSLGAGSTDDLHARLREIGVLRLNVKSFGYRIARELAPRLTKIDTATEPRPHGVHSKPATQADMESPWFAYWCNELKIAPVYHRKLWEYAFVLQTLFERGKLAPGMRGLGFGCGEEPIASYLASKGIDVTVTDLEPARARGLGWVETGQHATALEQAFKPEIIAKEAFDRRVRLEYVDMNDIPAHLAGKYDFCWSICALEHLGSIEQGLRFVERAMSTLKPGGLAVHTTEFNYLSQDDTISHGPVVMFLRKHLTDVKGRLERAGHKVKDIDFDVGDGILDCFIDVPPYAWEGRDKYPWENGVGHVKLSLDGFPCTCFGLIVERGG